MSKKYQEIMDQVQMTEEMKQRILQNVGRSLEETKKDAIEKATAQKDAARKAEQESTQNAGQDRKQNIKNPRAGKIISKKFFAYGKTSRYLSAAACIVMLIVGGLAVPKLINRETIVDPGESGPGVASAESQGEASQAGPMLGSVLPGNEQQEAENGEQQAMIANGMIEVNSLQELSQTLGFEVPEVKFIPFEVSSITYVNGWNEFAQVTYQGEKQKEEQEKKQGENQKENQKENQNETQEVMFRMAKGTDDISGDYNAYSAAKTIPVNGTEVMLKGSDDSMYELAIWQDGEFTYSLSFTPGGSEAVFTEMIQSMDNSEN